MSDPFVFRDPGSRIIPDPMARCHRCDGAANLVEGDGPAVCRSCIEQLGGIAADPHVTTRRVLEALQQRHGDVVLLARTRITSGMDQRLVWDWIAPWPGVEPH